MRERFRCGDGRDAKFDKWGGAGRGGGASKATGNSDRLCGNELSAGSHSLEGGGALWGRSRQPSASLVGEQSAISDQQSATRRQQSAVSRPLTGRTLAHTLTPTPTH